MEDIYDIKHPKLKTVKEKEDIDNNIKYQNIESDIKIELKEKELPYNLNNCVFCIKDEYDDLYENPSGMMLDVEEVIEEESENMINLMSNTKIENDKTFVLLNGTSTYHRIDDIDDIYGKEFVIKDTTDQWIINVPICYENGEVVKTELCADPGANSACVNTKWAVEHFPNMIMKNRGKKRMKTPGGLITPKYCIWMVFPSYHGKY